MSARNGRETAVREGPDHGPGPDDVIRLLRYSHIFASTVREILETKLLHEATPLPLSLPQLHLLKLMTYNGQHQVGELADFLGVSPPAATKNVDKLETYGLVVRSPSEGDRRATLLSVSPRGRRLVDRYEGLKASRMLPVLEVFDRKEILQLSDLLERFSVSLLALERPGRGFCLRCDAYIQNDCSIGKVRGGCPYQMARALRSGIDSSRSSS